MKPLKSVFGIAIFTLSTTIASFGQAGTILVASSPAVSPLNPNGDTWASACNCTFTTNDDGTVSEIPFNRIYQFGAEPSGDLAGGGACGTTDIMDNPSTGRDASYVYYKDPNGIANSGDEYVIYRIRIAKDPGSANFGFSVLIDSDGLIGRSDPNYISGNPGFEREIRVVNGGGSKGVYVDNVDGRTTGVNLKFYTLTSHTQRVKGLYTDASCNVSNVIFYDFYVMISDLGIAATAPLRLVTATSVNGSTALSAGASDIGGVDDNLMNSYGGSATANMDSMFTTLVKTQPSVTFGTLPVNLLYFKAQTKNAHTQLLWATASEQNNDYFNIEKSENGIDFSTIGTVHGAGNSQKLLNYSYTDNTPLHHKTYYRLKQVDFDGKWKYSPTIAIADGKDISRNISISVNNKNVADFEISAQENFLDLHLTDMLGKPLKAQQQYNSENGHLQVYIPENQHQSHNICVISINTTQGIYSRKVRLH